jgi:DNA-binding GntR family transcriptional regulator
MIADCEKADRKGGVTPDLVARAQAIDWDLHSTIIDSLGNAIITNAYRVNSIKIRLIRQEQTSLYDALVIPTMREHLAVIDAIATRDPAKAVEALGAHITNARNRAMGLR